MEKKWNIMEKKEVREKCCQMESVIQSIFKSPSSWVNGFIRLVSLEGTWYHHRATDIFIPMEQAYIDQLYRVDARPEKNSLRINSGIIVWDYPKEEEAVQILPNLPTSNMPRTVGTAGLGERCQNKRIFLKDGNIYDGTSKRIRNLQPNEEASILQIYRLGDQYKRKDTLTWNYDIYLWAKIGVIPSVLYASKDSWNTMQFLINNFSHIDFEEFLFGKESPISVDKKENQIKTAQLGMTKPEIVAKSEPMKKPETIAKPETVVKTEMIAKPEAVVKPEMIAKPEAVMKPEVIAKPEAAVKPEAIVKPEAVVKPEAIVKPEAAVKSEAIAKPEAVVKPEVIVKPEAVVKPETIAKPEAVVKSEAIVKPEVVAKSESAAPKIMEKSEFSAKSKILRNTESMEKLNQYEQQKETERLNKTEKIVIVQGEREANKNMDKIQELLDCDKNRCRLEPYDKDILFDIVRGHWELFDEESQKAKEVKENKTETVPETEEQLKTESFVTEETKEEETEEKNSEEVKTEENQYKNLIARDPKLDIRPGTVGIDFGTKSTVVVRQDVTNRIVPIRIGTGNLSGEVKEEDFENPTIIEFTNVKKFMEDYQKEAGRPHTSCNDIFVSYDAYEDFQNCKPDDFYSYFDELKQWANREKGNIIIKDKQRKEYYLGGAMEAEEKIINPVELYAYYIGLYINNMRNGIYLKYLMTFPVGYTKEVRDFIAESFYQGIKKSLPSSILNDKDCMDQFRVELGISEPAAYAVTALEQSCLDPKDETEQFMYGIFDFGGGTTDFDFGIWRGATEEEYEKDAYDYVLECFGADSDVTLGGENILELMAYEVYQKNLEVFREKKITFTLPTGENGFAGSETLLINSQIAKRNMSILKEELRPLWHQKQGWRKKYQLENESSNESDKEGIIVSLYNIDGEPVPQCVLEFSSQELIELIRNRIQKGINSFFQCLTKMFLYREEAQQEGNIIYIFLAGNSSKSVFVKELFQKKIEEYYNKSMKMGNEMGSSRFELIEPLNGEGSGKDHYMPNAKTGVAYGLLKSRDGSAIKIVKNYETDALQESRFHYYLGRDHRHHFDCKFSPADVEYGRWVLFQGATRKVVRIYYSNNPTADSKAEQMPIDNVPYKELQIEPQEDGYLFIRTVEPDMIEYAVAKATDEILDSEIKQCYFN